MFENLTSRERAELASRLQSAAVRFLAEYDALRTAPGPVNAAYGLCPGGDCQCPERCHVIPTAWLMCCVESGQARRELQMGRQS